MGLTTHYTITPRGLHRFNHELHTLKKYAKKMMSRRKDTSTFSVIDRELNQARIRELAYILDHAHIATPLQDGAAHLGNKIGLNNGQGCHQFLLVSPVEANPSADMLPVDSPLGQAIVGKHSGEVVKVAIPGGGQQAYVIDYII